MQLHPSNNFVVQPGISSGQFVIRLFKEQSINIWSTKGYPSFFFRSVTNDSHIRKIIKNTRNDIIVFTDDKEHLCEILAEDGIQVNSKKTPVLFENKLCDFKLVVLKIKNNLLNHNLCIKSGRIRVAFLGLQNTRDIRWRSIGIPSSAHIVIGAMQSVGCDVDFHAIPSSETDLQYLRDYDCVAIGVYEDLFPDTAHLVQKIRLLTDAPVILGGPMITQTGEIAAAHCDADAYLRGEAERSIGQLVIGITSIKKSNSVLQMLKLACTDGLMAKGDNWGALGNFNVTPVVNDFSLVELAFNKLSKIDFISGMEYSTSRGCPRSCFFCSHIHGKKFRPYPEDIVRKHLQKTKKALQKIAAKSGAKEVSNYILNINDDDLLLDSDRFMRILDLIHSEGFKIWGIQTSIESLNDDKERNRIFSWLLKGNYFVGEKPIIWLGTDAFLTQRLERLGKRGSTAQIDKICSDIYAYGFKGYHYWIVTDADSDWKEMTEELQILDALKSGYQDSFHVMPNTSTIIPYPHTPLYSKRIKQGQHNRIVLKSILSIPGFPEFDYPLVLHERPSDDYLYALVEPYAQTPEKLLVDSTDFIDFIRDSRFKDAIMECMRVLNIVISHQVNRKKQKELCSVLDCIRSYMSAILGGENEN